ncbi:MAG TPA: HAD family phosphatase, partial [Candidatus Limnocylindria bacterium]|nr:HAD family phosphatase [Candidatus Limnocylindria bacterium]
RKYFHYIIDASGVKRGKPSPDIFLKAARNLKVKPSDCIIFEDTFHGIEAAKRAGMKVVALATSHPAKEIRHADLVIKDFTKIKISKLLKLF